MNWTQNGSKKFPHRQSLTVALASYLRSHDPVIILHNHTS